MITNRSNPAGIVVTIKIMFVLNVRARFVLYFEIGFVTIEIIK